MKKGTFKIKMKTEKRGWIMEEVEGYYSTLFGIHKVNRSYSVTHLNTGLRMSMFDYLRQARSFVKEAESMDWPVPWDSSTHAKDFKANAEVAWPVVNKHRFS